MNEKTSAVTTSQPPQRTSEARTRSVRASLRVNQAPATSPMSAAGSSQETSDPKDTPNIRVMPVAPRNYVAATATAGARTAEDPTQSVVADGQLPQRVALRAADVGAGSGGPNRHQRDVPAGRDDNGSRRGEQVQQRRRIATGAATR